ncbi:MAG: HepT-like ribonuclease domain-containing protein [Jatrophihabitans sp.]
MLRKADAENGEWIPDLSRIVDLRNILAYGYAVIDDTVVCSAVPERLPAFLPVVEDLLAEIE